MSDPPRKPGDPNVPPVLDYRPAGQRGGDQSTLAIILGVVLLLPGTLIVVALAHGNESHGEIDTQSGLLATLAVAVACAIVAALLWRYPRGRKYAKAILTGIAAAVFALALLFLTCVGNPFRRS